MVGWNEYIDQILSSVTDFNDITISLGEGIGSVDIPPIIKASVTMLDKFIEHQGQRNLLVFPEKTQSIFIFTLMTLFHNISSGEIKSNYDPLGFKVGEKLKVGNAIVEYLGIEVRNEERCLMIKLADLDKCSAPIDDLPVFQKVETKRNVSKYSQYVRSKKIALEALHGERTSSNRIDYISEMKTHMESSIFTMTSVAAVKELLSKCKINGKKATSIFYMAQADFEGKITIMSPGQMSGIPSIVFASDLYSINEAIEQGNPVQSIIIDGSNTVTLEKQLEALDELLKRNIPIVCITDVPNSFELDIYTARNFNIWRWDKTSLTEKLCGVGPLAMNRKIMNSAKHTVDYLQSEGKEISVTMGLLAAHRHETEEQSPQAMRLYNKLNNLTFKALRMITTLADEDKNIANRTLNECIDLLNAEKWYLPEAIVKDYIEAIENLRVIYGPIFKFSKINTLQDFLRRKPDTRIYLIVPENSSKSKIQNYWDQWSLQSLTRSRIKVLSPQEYYSWPMDETDITVICGWMNKTIMRKIIFSFNTSQYIVLLYDYENKWKSCDLRYWNKILEKSSNKSIIERFLPFTGIRVSTERYDQYPVNEGDEPKEDELEEIELILRENRVNQYTSIGKRNEKDVVTAIPISFVGGYLSFYRTGHKVISATKIINSSAGEIESKLASELSIGDFIVVREADKDIIRDLADIALENSGRSNLRGQSAKWREALKIELMSCNIEELYQKLLMAGCKKEYSTIKNWIEDEEIIAPRSKEDLRTIANVTHNKTLIEHLDAIFEAAQEVRRAHILAGRKLSGQLKKRIAKELKKGEGIDQFNFWEPIDMEIEGIGTVKILKIIDISSEVSVAVTDTNRLIED